MNRVVVVDYGAGNLLSVCRAFQHVGAQVVLADGPAAVAVADRLVVPGVGAFGDCMGGLRRRGLVEPILEFCGRDRPFLGICVGMQMMFEASEEFGEHPGLGLLPGRVTAIPATGADGHPHKIPHIGWNRLLVPEGGVWTESILKDLAPGAWAYFVHSFAGNPVDPTHRLADTDYDGRIFPAAVRRGGLFGTQFHPEKSGAVGLTILRRFLAM
ncbi:MAG: imidazole glycerol phosphate synthase subunit HisH [Magnetospirillum sp. WYHS-4]